MLPNAWAAAGAAVTVREFFPTPGDNATSGTEHVGGQPRIADLAGTAR
jgi:hypothetical protein